MARIQVKKMLPILHECKSRKPSLETRQELEDNPLNEEDQSIREDSKLSACCLAMPSH